MAISLAKLQGFRDELFEGRMSGARRFRDQNGEEIEFRSDGEIAKALAAVDAEIAAYAGKPASTILFNTSKGI